MEETGVSINPYSKTCTLGADWRSRPLAGDLMIE
ncbi:hypothetical protein OKW30_007987 [Paraburkholderia sp. Clong3]